MLDVGLGFGPYFLGEFKEAIGFSGIYAVTAVAALACAGIYYFAYAKRRGKQKENEADDITDIEVVELEEA